MAYVKCSGGAKNEMHYQQYYGKQQTTGSSSTGLIDIVAEYDYNIYSIYMAGSYWYGYNSGQDFTKAGVRVIRNGATVFEVIPAYSKFKIKCNCTDAKPFSLFTTLTEPIKAGDTIEFVWHSSNANRTQAIGGC